jgi:hypothetical protein
VSAGSADDDSQPGAAVVQVKQVEVDRADGSIILEPGDDEEPAVASVMVEHVVEPALLHRQADRAADGDELRRPGVGQPSHEERDVGSLAGPEKHQAPPDQRLPARAIS